jgi:hypothetical protein
MKYLKLYEKKNTFSYPIKKAPEKKAKTLPKLSVEELLNYSKAENIVNKYKSILLTCAKKYANFNKEQISHKLDLDPDEFDEFDVENAIVTNDQVNIELYYYDDYAGNIDVPLDEFSDFCNNYEMYVNSKKYNL